jgi:hypothetical protein
LDYLVKFLIESKNSKVMSDPIKQFLLAVEQELACAPQPSIDSLQSILQAVLNKNPQLKLSLQRDEHMAQYNSSDGTAFQTAINGGVANIGIHFHGTNSEELKSGILNFLKSLQPLAGSHHQDLPMRSSSQTNSTLQSSVASIRQLIVDELSDDNLSDLCLDNFLEVYNQFISGQTKSHRVRLLVDYVVRQREIPKLLNAIKHINPNVYREHFSITPSPESSLLVDLTEKARELLMAAFESNDKIIFVLTTNHSESIIANDLNFIDRLELLSGYKHALTQLIEKKFIIELATDGYKRYELAAKGYEFCIAAVNSNS